MTTAVTICSNALLELGADPINSLEEGTKFARLCANLYPSLRDDVLRAHYWKCATKRVTLSPQHEGLNHDPLGHLERTYREFAGIGDRDVGLDAGEFLA